MLCGKLSWSWLLLLFSHAELLLIRILLFFFVACGDRPWTGAGKEKKFSQTEQNQLNGINPITYDVTRDGCNGCCVTGIARYHYYFRDPKTTSLSMELLKNYYRKPRPKENTTCYLSEEEWVCVCSNDQLWGGVSVCVLQRSIIYVVVKRLLVNAWDKVSMRCFSICLWNAACRPAGRELELNDGRSRISHHGLSRSLSPSCSRVVSTKHLHQLQVHTPPSS